MAAVYEAKMKVWSLIIGLAVCMTLNANALTIYEKLSKSGALRTMLIEGKEVKELVNQLKQDGTTHQDIRAELAHLSDVTNRLNDVDLFEPHSLKGTTVSTLIGWLLTAFLIGVGAPFWNDLFDALLRLRKGIKPQPA